jgi:hypothetical protein
LASLILPTSEARRKATHGFFRDPLLEQKVIDFHDYQQVAVVEALEAMARVIKEETHHKKLVTFFYGYLFEIGGIPMGPQNSGHLALARLLKCPEVDILCSPISYQDRANGGIGHFMTVVDSVRRAGKLWLNEDDTRTHLTYNKTPFGFIQPIETEQAGKWVHARNLAQIIPRRMACWFMDLGNEGWLNSEGLWSNIGNLKAMYQKLLAEPACWSPEVAIVVDERSPFYLADRWELTRYLLPIFRSDYARMGAPHSLYLLSDVLEGRVTLPKVTLFLACFHITDSERESLLTALQGKTALWFYGSGYLGDKTTTIVNTEALTGVEFEEKPGGITGSAIYRSGLAMTKNLEGKRAGPEVRLEPGWSVEEREGVIPSADYSEGGIAIASRSYRGVNSIHVGTLGCPAGFLRNVVKEAGCHVYLDSDDLVLTDGRFLAVSASDSGTKTLNLPKGNRLVRFGSETVLNPQGTTFAEEFQKGETRYYLLDKP